MTDFGSHKRRRILPSQSYPLGCSVIRVLFDMWQNACRVVFIYLRRSVKVRYLKRQKSLDSRTRNVRIKCENSIWELTTEYGWVVQYRILMGWAVTKSDKYFLICTSFISFLSSVSNNLLTSWNSCRNRFTFLSYSLSSVCQIINRRP